MLGFLDAVGGQQRLDGDELALQRLGRRRGRGRGDFVGHAQAPRRACRDGSPAAR